MYVIALYVHIAAVILWLGAIFFFVVLLDRVLGTTDQQQRLESWEHSLRKLFPWAWLCIAMALATGFYMIYSLGGFSAMNMPVTIMAASGILMMVIFKILYAAPMPHLSRGIDENKWEVAEYALGTIRKLMTAILGLGAITLLVVISMAGFL